jgi:hypothetical protein
MFPHQGLHGDRCFVSRANSLFLHFYFSESPKKEPCHEMRGKPTVTVHEAPRGRTAYIQCGAAWFSVGDRLRHCYYYPSAMQPSARYLPPWLGQTTTLSANVCRSNPQQGIPSTIATAFHVTQGGVEYESTSP